MKNLPSDIIRNIEVLKSVILTRSGLLSEYGDNVSIIMGDIAYNEKENKVYELVFEIKIINVDCPECDFEPENISEVILELKNKIYKSSVVGLTEKLQLKNTFSSLRGVLFYDCKMWRDNFETLTFGIFFDPEMKY